MQHLLELGHQRVAFVGGGHGLRQHVERAQGAREAIIAAGIDPTTGLVEVNEDRPGHPGRRARGGAPARGNLPTGVFCGNDMMAFGVYRGLTRAGVKVPR